MKITVYAIAKNEEKFVDIWVESMKEADHIVVLDTGSTDNTVDKLRKLGVYVETAEIIPWRFDEARNKSLQLVPSDTDLCVCTDLDECFEKGWREKLEKVYNPNVQKYRYRYTWSFNADGSEGVVFWIEKIHANKCFKWTHPVHEVLTYFGEVPLETATAFSVQLNHFPDSTKSRSNYLPLLELSVEEQPDDDRNVHYLGREYMFHRRYDEAIDTLTHHLKIANSTWKDERCASMRYISKCLLAQNNMLESELWSIKAISEAPHLREPYIDLASFYYQQGNWYGVVLLMEKALKIKERSMSYINEPESWGALPYDLLSLAYFFIGDYEKALCNIDKAIELSTDPRLVTNKKFFEEKLCPNKLSAENNPI